ncbi:MAG: LPS export ABC transporter periplasmic protein LptC [Azonexus sp.]|jgi:lipopolysaccharide export system protein LptC
MKIGASQLFTIVLLALLAGLSFWLERAVAPAEVKRDGKLRHDPDAIAENVLMRQLDEEGRVKYRLTAPHLNHFPDDDSSELKNPILVHYRPNAAPVTVSGDNARVTSKGQVVFLWDNVNVTRAATAERPAAVARMPDLTVQPDDGIAFTQSPVEINEEKSWVKGVGMHLDNNTSTFVLQSQVTGLYYPRRVQK